MFILDIKRTAIGKFLGSLSNLKATDIIYPLFTHFLSKYNFLRNRTDEVIIGNVLSAGLGQNPARIAACQGGISKKSPAFTLNHVCGSGLTSIIEGIKSIKLGDAQIVIAGGMESMSNAPYLLNGIRQGNKFGNQIYRDSLYTDGLFCKLTNSVMGMTAEKLAKKYNISRHKQDEYSHESHLKAIAALEEGYFKDEIVAIDISSKKEKIKFFMDEQPRLDSDLGKLSKLKPLYKKNGTVTAGNISGINDGAALSVLISERALGKYKLKPTARIIGYNYIGLDPSYMGLGPYYSIKELIKKTKFDLNNIDLFEINEAFAAQSIAVINLLGIDPKKVNINGGAIALGHPLGASGARILSTLIYSLKRKNKNYGIASLCIGGGQGVSVLVENL